MGTLFTIESLTVISVSFGAYFLGIFLRFIALPGKDPMPLGRQYAIGFVLSFAIVTPFLVIMRIAFFGSETNAATALATIGIILEHGFVMNDTWTRKIDEMINRDTQSPPTPDP